MPGRKRSPLTATHAQGSKSSRTYVSLSIRGKNPARSKRRTPQSRGSFCGPWRTGIDAIPEQKRFPLPKRKHFSLLPSPPCVLEKITHDQQARCRLSTDATVEMFKNVENDGTVYKNIQRWTNNDNFSMNFSTKNHGTLLPGNRRIIIENSAKQQNPKLVALNLLYFPVSKRVFYITLLTINFHEKGKPPERVGRKASGLSLW
jgi:hypothetical protein